MKTDDLIDLIARDAKVGFEPRHSMLFATCVMLLFSGVATLVTLGPRTDLITTLLQSPALLKWLVALLTAIPAWLLLRNALRPEFQIKGRLKWFLAPPLLVVALAVWSIANAPVDERMDLVRGSTLMQCLVSIPAFALPILAGLLWALRLGAVTDATRTGALAGLCAGALSAALYSMHCIEDDPAFFGIWYSVGVAAVTILGGLLGPRLLRW